MSRLWRAVQQRLNLAPVLDAIQASHPDGHIPIGDAPPVSLGRVAAILIGLLIVSGFGLLLYYKPTAEGAAPSLAALHQRQPVGWLIHNAHRWSALLLLITVILHALRGWLTRAYRPPRDLNWWVGLALLLLTLAMGGSGYLLRWDIKAFTLMELIVSSFSDLPVLGPILVGSMLGGTELGEVPLYRGFAIHVWVLPGLLASLVGLHLLIAWRQGLAERPRWWARLRSRLPAVPGFAWLPVLALLAGIILLSAVTPHEGQAGPSQRSGWPHPDWLLSFYLIPFWLSERSTRLLAAVVLPAALLTGLIVAPRLAGLGRYRPWVMTGLAVLGVVVAAGLIGQVVAIGATVPSQGCTACHRAGILGGAPAMLTEFRIRDPDWLMFHLREPEISILEPALPPESLP